jgi:hypothetical protein
MKPKSLFVFAMLLIPALAFAAEKKSANVLLDQPVTVAGTPVAPGQYHLTWEGSGSDVTVTFLAGKKTVATAPAKLVNTSSNAPVAIETQTNPDKTLVLRAIDLKNQTIQFQTPVSAAGN